MWKQALPVLLGFFLTTVLGGLFASFLQQRSWRHQNEMRLREEDRNRASDVCRSLSALVDKRLYRMRRWLWGICDYAGGRVEREVLDARLRDYHQVLLEWNDELNARMAIVGAYFGRDLRDFLDQVVYEAFKDAGQHLESLYRVTATEPTTLDVTAVAAVTAKLETLADLSYQLSFAMMVRLREGKVGRYAPAMLGEAPLNDHGLSRPGS